MVPVFLICHQSTLAVKSRVGAITKPALSCLDFSGPNVGFPPDSVLGLMASQPGVALTTFAGHFAGSTIVAPEVGDSVIPLNNWLNVGTRKPVLYEPRTSTCSMGT